MLKFHTLQGKDSFLGFQCPHYTPERQDDDADADYDDTNNNDNDDNNNDDDDIEHEQMGSKNLVPQHVQDLIEIICDRI